MEVKQHPFYDDAFEFLPDDHWLRYHLAKDLLSSEEVPEEQSDADEYEDNDGKYYNERPELIDLELSKKEGTISHNFAGRGDHPAMINGIYRVPLILVWLGAAFLYWKQFTNDPMHIISNILDAIITALEGEGLTNPFTLSKKMRDFFDGLGGELRLPSQYSIPRRIIANRSHVK